MRFIAENPEEVKPAAETSAAESPIREIRAFLDAESSLEKRMQFISLVRWVWAPRHEIEFRSRLARCLQFLAHDPGLQRAFSAALISTLESMDSVSLFAEVGLPSHKGLLSEGMRRIVMRLLPAAQNESDTARLLAELFPSQEEVHRFLALPEETFAVLRKYCWIQPEVPQSTRLPADLEQALRLLATRIAGRGVSAAIRQRSSIQEVEASPFYQFIFYTDALIRTMQGSLEETPNDVLTRWKTMNQRCREELEQVHQHMDSAGVNSDLVFDLHSIDVSLDRMELLVATLAATGEREKIESTHELLCRLVQARLEDTRLSKLLSRNLNLLARKTVERTGKGGEHYIALTRREYWKMWLAAFGGGLLTVLTAAVKMRIMENNLPPFVEGFLTGTNYAVSFLLLQVFGFALATKQPSMTAATFAGLVRENRGYARWNKVADFVACITRTQLAAAVGNVIAVTAGAIGFERLWKILFSKSYLPAESAQHVYQTLHPFSSGTALYAIITGIILWLAALIGGWVENFAVYHRIPEAITQHPLGRYWGTPRLRKIAAKVERNLAGWATSISLGYMLGFLPDISRFFGVPLDVRHVTLNTGTLALAAARFGTSSFGHNWLYAAMAGIGITFVLNLGVSFSIAAYVALRAYDVPRREQMQLVGFLMKRMALSPLRFLFPTDQAKEISVPTKLDED